jgi:hypothetical protein
MRGHLLHDDTFLVNKVTEFVNRTVKEKLVHSMHASARNITYVIAKRIVFGVLS